MSEFECVGYDVADNNAPRAPPMERTNATFCLSISYTFLLAIYKITHFLRKRCLVIVKK